MSKKQKRQISQQSTTSATARVAAPAAASFSRKPLGQTEFKPDYSHVISSLKRIAMLAGSFFVILIVLSFFLK
jgi:hypothetical protein